MSSLQKTKMSNKPKSNIASKIPTSGRDSGTHSRSSSVSNLTTASDLHSEIGDATSDSTEDFKIEERVWVNGTKPGCIKFIGKTQFAPGVWAGVILDEPVGKNDGSVAGVKYFTCEPLRGIFARPSKLTRTAGPVSGIGDSAVVGSVSTPPKSSNLPSSRSSVGSNISTPSPKYTKLKVGDRITVSSLSGLKSGTLKYIGETDFAKGEWAGIELDEPTGKNDGSVAGKRYFSCELKYGLFAPLHKVSHPGATPVSRPGSVRGTPLLRSSSRDSINSSVSNSSRASRVKLGITSLTSAQKSRTSGGMGITSTTKAFEEAIKEKEQHIEQLLKERELDRAEFARLASHFEQIETKSSELEKKQKVEESNKKSLQEQLTALQKKLEDIQFQLEEEKIAKTDFEAQLHQRKQILKNIEEYISKESGEKFLNIKEILSGQETLSEIRDTQIASDTEQKKIAELEAIIKILSEEKHEILNQVVDLQKCAGESTVKHESLIVSLNTTLQEKDDMIANLKNELNNSIEKVTQLIEDNKNLKEQILLKEEQAKGHADDVIKELGEKIFDLVKEIERLTNCVQEKEEQLLKTQNELSAFQSTIQELDGTVQQLSEKIQQADLNLATASRNASEKITSLQNDLSAISEEKVDMKSEYEKEIGILKTAIKVQEDELQSKLNVFAQHESEISLLTEKMKRSDGECASLKKEVEELSEKSKDFVKEKGNLEASLKAKDEVIADLSKQVESLKKSLDKDNLTLENSAKQLQSLQDSLNMKEEENNQLTSKLHLAEQKVEMLNKDSSDHVMALQNELSKVKEESTSTKTHLEQELSKMKNEREKLNDVLKEKDASLLETEEILTSLEKKLEEKDLEISDMSTQNADMSLNISKYIADIEKTKKEEEKLTSTLSEYEAKLSQKEQELLNAKNNNEQLSGTINEKEKAIFETEKIVTSLQIKLKDRETEFSNLLTQNAGLLKRISKFSADSEELSTSKAELDSNLKEKDQIIQDIQDELIKFRELLENKTKELNSKEGEINVLKGVIQEKESQFDELSQMVESSQNQLTLLKEQNAKHETLLQSKESFINDFKTDQEKQLQLKEQSFKEETSRFENLLHTKDEEIDSKQAYISNLLNEIENKKKFIESLQTELEVIKTDKKKISDDSSNIYQELNNRIMEMEEKYCKLIEEKEKMVKIAKDELHTRDAKNNLELVRDTLLQEKSAQEELVKDREAKLEALQAEVNRMQTQFSQHKLELQQKLDVSETELLAALELKNELVIQHNVSEELQQNLHNSDEKCKKLEAQVQMIPAITSEKQQLQAQVDEFQKINRESSEMVAKMKKKNSTLEEQLKNNKNLIEQKEEELLSLKEQIQNLKQPSDKIPSDLSLKLLEEENDALKKKIICLELENFEKKSDASTKPSMVLSPEDAEEKESLRQQIDFLNSIIVDLKQKNEKLSEQLEAQATCWGESDVNLNEPKKAIAPRLFCDICEVFDLHETDDCPKQESFADEAVPQLIRAGTRQLEDRPYCNNCEMFGHWTLDCQEPETF